MYCIVFSFQRNTKKVAIIRCTKSTYFLQSEIYFQYDTICEISPQKYLLLISNLEHPHLINCTRQLHLGALCVEICKWAHNDYNNNNNDERGNSVAVSEADLVSVYVL